MAKALTFNERMEIELKHIFAQRDRLVKKKNTVTDAYQQKVAPIEQDIEVLDAQASALRQALKAFSNVTLSDLIYAILAAAKKPVALVEINKELIRQDVSTNYSKTSAAVTRDKRFRRIGSGLYAIRPAAAIAEPTIADQDEIETVTGGGDEIDEIIAAELAH